MPLEEMKKGTYYKYLVVAYKWMDGKKKTLSVSKTAHVVTKKGVVTAKKSGTCDVYVYVQNGVRKKVKLTVKS